MGATLGTSQGVTNPNSARSVVARAQGGLSHPDPWGQRDQRRGLQAQVQQEGAHIADLLRGAGPGYEPDHGQPFGAERVGREVIPERAMLGPVDGGSGGQEEAGPAVGAARGGGGGGGPSRAGRMEV